MRRLYFFLTALMTTLTLSAQTTFWTNDKEHTRIGFEVNHAGLSFVSGYFSDFTVNVKQDERHMNLTQISVEIRSASVKTGVAARDKHLSSADFFHVEKYPVLTFHSTTLKVKGKKGKIYGDLTLHGVTRPVVLDALLIGRKNSPVSGKDTAGFRLQGSIKCSDFQFGPKYIPAMIADEVKLIVDAEFYID